MEKRSVHFFDLRVLVMKTVASRGNKAAFMIYLKELTDFGGRYAIRNADTD